MKIKCLVVGQLQTNCYLVWDEQTGEGIIIDPGDDADFITQKIKDLNITPRAILATHGHFDHLLAATELKLIHKIPFMLHKGDLVLLGRMRESARRFTGTDPGPKPQTDKFLKGKDLIKFGQEKLKVIETPGHSPGGVAFYSKGRGVLFSGDTLFKGAVGRTDLSYSSPKDLEKSIKKLLRLLNDTQIFPGHGSQTTVMEAKNLLKHFI